MASRDAGGSIGGTERKVAETKFTKGPWQKCCFSPQIEAIDPDGNVTIIATLKDGFPVEREANTRLIAAAPELYDALAAGWFLLRNGTKDKETGISVDLGPWLDKVRAALAKARGEQR